MGSAVKVAGFIHWLSNMPRIGSVELYLISDAQTKTETVIKKKVRSTSFSLLVFFPSSHAGIPCMVLHTEECLGF